jgi:nicotinate-nucleotide adenylyltransferase
MFSDFELIAAAETGEATYTYRTLETLKELEPNHSWYFIMGADSLRDLPTWREPQRICDACTLAVGIRSQFGQEELAALVEQARELYGARIEVFTMRSIDISSTDLREMIGRGESIRYLIPDAAADYIRESGIYLHQEKNAEDTKTMAEQTYNLEEMSKRLSKYIDANRYYHTQGVRFMSAALAMAHGADIMKAETAGLLHDCAKCLSDTKKIKICDKNHISISSVERDNPFLLHSKVGAYIAKEKYGITDEEILDAIRYHTTGRPGMRMLEQIVFIADYIEPRRNKSRHLPEIRLEAFRDLDECCYLILKDMLIYLHSRSGEIDSNTQEAFRFYEEVHEERRD